MKQKKFTQKQSKNILTYNTQLYVTSEIFDFWKDILTKQHDCVNYIIKEILGNNLELKIKPVHHELYYSLRDMFPRLSSQIIIKCEQEAIQLIKIIRSQAKTLHQEVPNEITKSKYSLRLYKCLYSKLSEDNINLISNTPNKRDIISFYIYPKLHEMFSRYKTSDPIIFLRNGKLYLSIGFEIPTLNLQNNQVLGIDLGCKRLVTTSNGQIIDNKKAKARKRQIRHLKRILKSKKRFQHLKKLSHKEHNFNKNYTHWIANQVLKLPEATYVLEDLTGIKRTTSKNKDGHNRKNHNNRMSQVPFFMLRNILTYKAQTCGKQVVTVSPAYTSQIDSISGKKDGIRSGCRYYSKSGLIYDADWNAAINIKNRFEHPISKEMDNIIPLHHLIGRVSSITQMFTEKSLEQTMNL